MAFTTLVKLVTVFATLPLAVVGTGYGYSSAPPACETITATADLYGNYKYCEALACLSIKPVTQHCGCPPVGTVTVGQTACPTGCASTSYITAVEDCFPTSPPPYVSTTTTPPPYYTTTTTTPNPYYPTKNTTSTTTTTTVTTCPAYSVCTTSSAGYTTATTSKLSFIAPPPSSAPSPTKSTTTSPAPQYSQANVAGHYEAPVGTGLIGVLLAIFGLM